MNDNVREFIKAEADFIAESLKKYFGGDWEVTVNFDETTGEVTLEQKLRGIVTEREFMLEIPSDFWNQH